MRKLFAAALVSAVGVLGLSGTALAHESRPNVSFGFVVTGPGHYGPPPAYYAPRYGYYDARADWRYRHWKHKHWRHERARWDDRRYHDDHRRGGHRRDW